MPSLSTLLSEARPAAQRSFLPTRYRHTLHSYQALPPWSVDGKHLLYAGFDDYSRCDIVVRDMESGEESAVAQTPNFNYHCASWQHWALNDSAIIFRGQDRPDSPYPTLTHLDSGTSEPVEQLAESLIRQVINHGKDVVFYRFDKERRIGRMGIFDLNSRRFSLEVESEEIAAKITIGPKPDPHAIGFQHVVANPSGTRLFFKADHRSFAGNAERERSFHAFDIASRRVTDFGMDILGHPSWIDDRFIANIQKTHDGSDDRWLVAMDSETGEVHRLHDVPISGAGHPAVSPDGHWLATDSFAADGKSVTIYLMDLWSGTVRQIDQLDHNTQVQSSYNPHVITRSHPHPTWAPDSKTLLANYNFAGDHLGLVVWNLTGDSQS